MKNNHKKKKKLKDFNHTLVMHRKESFLHKIYYKIITIPFLYKHKRILKYLTLGLVGTIVDFVLLFLLTDIFGLFYLLSATISFSAAVTVNFLLNKKFTFKYENKKLLKNIKAYFSYFVISLMSLVLTLIFMAFFVEIIGLGYMLAKIIISLALLFFRYFGHSRCFR